MLDVSKNERDAQFQLAVKFSFGVDLTSREAQEYRNQNGEYDRKKVIEFLKERRKI